MKSVVITGSARGLGFSMAKLFREADYNVIISDLFEDKLIESKDELEKLDGKGLVLYKVCDVTKEADLQDLISCCDDNFGNIDIWINNAGVNQPDKAIWELSSKEIDLVVDVDLRGAIIGSKLAMNYMMRKGKGAIYNIEGYGSNDAMMLGLSIYGSSKRAITYFTQALAKESEERNTGK